MNRGFNIILCSALAMALLLTAGCGKSDKEKYGSAPFFVESATAMIDALKETLPKKNPPDVGMMVARVSGALKSVPALVPSPAGKAKAQKAADMFENDMKPTLVTMQYDPAVMGKKLDEIRAAIVEVGKEVK